MLRNVTLFSIRNPNTIIHNEYHAPVTHGYNSPIAGRDNNTQNVSNNKPDKEAKSIAKRTLLWTAVGVILLGLLWLIDKLLAGHL